MGAPKKHEKRGGDVMEGKKRPQEHMNTGKKK